MHTVTITGANGFIGRNLVKHLDSTKLFKIKEFKGDIMSPMDVESIKSDSLVHLAGVNRSTDPFKLVDTNVIGTYNIIKVCLDKKIKLLVAGSLQNQGFYAASKKITEAMLLNLVYCGLNGAYIKLTNVFGPECKPNYNSFVSTILYSIANNIPYKELTDNPKKILRLIHVKDVCQHIEGLLLNDFHSFAEELSLASPYSIDLWHGGEFNITIHDFAAIAEGKKPIHDVPERAKNLIKETLEWYKEDAAAKETRR